MRRSGSASEIQVPASTSTAQSQADQPKSSDDRARVSSPLVAYSLRGRAAEFEQQARSTTPLLGDLCLAGQATILYAPPNAGKTLITLKLTIDAVAAGRIAAGDVFYINADDSSSGLATKLNIMDELGAHTLVPGFYGFKAVDLIDLLRRAAQLDRARGSLVILDTLKKFSSLMDKKDASAFADACRQFVMRGGSIVALAHTTKNPNADGELRYGGTTDFIEDFDAAYVLTPLQAKAAAGERVAEFKLKKRRGDNPDTVAYAYAAEAGISYEERLASVRTVDLDQLDTFRNASQQLDDATVIAAVTACVGEGVTGKMALMRTAAARTGASERAITRVIERYTGDDHSRHRWTFSRGDRGVMMFALLPDT